MADNENSYRSGPGVGQGNQNANRSDPLGDTQPNKDREGTSQCGSGG